MTKHLLLLLLLLQYSVATNAADCQPLIAVYPTWKHSDAALTQLPWYSFTHLALFAAYPNEDASLNSTEVDVLVAATVKTAKLRNKKLILVVGGAGDASKEFRAIASNNTSRQKFAKNVATYIADNQLDGVDIDWEYWTYQNEQSRGGNDPIESQYLVELLAELRAQLPANILLTTDIMAGSWLGDQYLVDIQNHVDYVNLMAFDFTGAWPQSPVDHHADFKTFKKAIDFSLNKGFNKNKLLIGLPAYGKEFMDGKNKEVKSWDYSDIVAHVESNQKVLNKGRYKNIYFENTKNVLDKVNVVKSSNLAGVTFFEITADHPDKELSLINRASSNLNPSECYR